VPNRTYGPLKGLLSAVWLRNPSTTQKLARGGEAQTRNAQQSGGGGSIGRMPSGASACAPSVGGQKDKHRQGECDIANEFFHIFSFLLIFLVKGLLINFEPVQK
jgi:hypothetical protein